MKKVKILTLVATVVTFLAAIVSSTACFSWAYQPRTPKSLTK